MDFEKIRLANERNEHVTKRLNRLSTWKFFKVIYRENIWRMFGYNFLMLLLLIPMLVVGFLGSLNVNSVQNALPLFNGFGFSTGAWIGTDGIGSVGEYLAEQIRNVNTVTGAWIVLASLLLTVMFSGGFAVIRDAFWTGKLSTVGVFKSMWKGIKANILYALISNMIISGMAFGIYELFIYVQQVMGILWLAIVLAIVLGIVALFVTMYLLILCSVSVTYKQSVYENLDDAWRLLWLNIWPNLIHVILALLPFALYLAFTGSLFQQLIFILLFMFGGLYFPLVWHTFMMKSFALFHPVEPKKKKQAKTDEIKIVEPISDPDDSSEQPQAREDVGGRKKKRPKSVAQQNAEQTDSAEQTSAAQDGSAQTND